MFTNLRPGWSPCQAFSIIRERDHFRVYLKVRFCGVRHHLLKGFDQNVASWNPRSTQTC
jgi:hypothetical protein